MRMIGTVTATSKAICPRVDARVACEPCGYPMSEAMYDDGPEVHPTVERSIPPLEVRNDAHVFHIEDRAVEETFPEEKFQTGWTFTSWFTIAPEGS